MGIALEVKELLEKEEKEKEAKKDIVVKNKEGVVTDDKVFEMPELELSEEMVVEVEKTVLEANKLKAKDELTDVIEEAKKKRLEELSEQNKPIFEKAAELAKLEENKDLSNDELYELAHKEISEKDNEDGDADKDNPVKGDFFGHVVNQDGELDSLGNPIKTTTEFIVPEDVKPEWEQFNEVKKDPVYSAFLEFKKNGGTDFVEMIAKSGLTVDPKSLSHEQLKHYELNQLKQNDSSITDEDISEYMEEFNSKTKLEKAAEVSSIRSQLEEQRKEALKYFQGELTSKGKHTKETTAKAVQEAESELERIKANVGIDVSDEVVKSVMSKVRKDGFVFTKSDGTPDAERAVRVYFLENNYQDMRSEAFNEGRKYEARKEATKRSKPLSGLSVRGSVSRPKVVDAKKEVADIIKKKMEGASKN